jgi:hypothetical protein
LITNQEIRLGTLIPASQWGKTLSDSGYSIGLDDILKISEGLAKYVQTGETPGTKGENSK